MRDRQGRLFIYLKQLILNVSTHRAAHKARPCEIKRGCTRLADMLPSKYEDNALQIKEKSTERTASFFCTRSYRPFCCRYFEVSIPIRKPYPTANPPSHSCHLHWLTIRSFTVLLNLTKAVSTAAEKENTDAARQESGYFGILKRHGKVYIRQSRTITNPISG